MRSLLEQATQPTMIEITVVMRPSSSSTTTTTSTTAAATTTRGERGGGGGGTSGAEQQRQVAINARATVGDLKQSIASTFSIPSSEYQISFDDRVLTNDGQRLGDCGIRAGSVVRVQSRGTTPTTDRAEQRLIDRVTHRHDVEPQSRQ